MTGPRVAPVLRLWMYVRTCMCGTRARQRPDRLTHMCSRLRYGVRMPASRERGCVCVCVSFFRLHRGEEGRVSVPHTCSPELAGQEDRNQEHEDALFAFAKTNHPVPTRAAT